MMRFIKRALLSLFVLGVVGGAVGFLWRTLKTPPVENNIYDYDEARDTDFILKFFDDDFYWLVAGYSREEYPAEIKIRNRSTSWHPRDYGKLQIKVYRLNENQPVGFVAYYKEFLSKGTLLFLAVAPEFRGKGYAKKLLNYACDDLFSQGCSTISLITRVDNYPAQHVYEQSGFVEEGRDDTCVYYFKTKNS